MDRFDYIEKITDVFDEAINNLSWDDFKWLCRQTYRAILDDYEMIDL